MLLSGVAAGVWTVMAGDAATVLPGGLLAAGSVLALVGLLAVISGRLVWAAVPGRVAGLVLVVTGTTAATAGYLFSGPAVPGGRTASEVSGALGAGSPPPVTRGGPAATPDAPASVNAPASTPTWTASQGSAGVPDGSSGGREDPGALPFYANCAAVRAAGAAPIVPGDPGWRSAFDRDGDGVGCE